jgi:hypothetical protein
MGAGRLRALWLFAIAALLAAVPAATAQARTHRAAVTTAGCRLSPANGRIKHLVYVQFDNTHLRRDRQGIPSDLEQMPHLLNFMRGQGTLLSNDHTVLIAHTAGGILSTLTGVYPDRTGIAVSNSYRTFNPDGSSSFASAFGYWTDPVSASDSAFNMVTPDGHNAPAPWVPFTRAGCNFGSVSTANTILENTGTGPSGDMTKVFGSGSPEWNEAVASAAAPAGSKTRNQAQTDFVGIGVHCAQGNDLCSSSNGGRADVLPDEPGGYSGFNALFGAKYTDPAITGGQAGVNDLDGNPIQDPTGNPGFPGFDGMSASVSLGYVAQMQEHGVPVTFAYISDAHDDHAHSQAFGPGEAGYVAQLHSYDVAFQKFFQRLAADGINRSNTLFAFTVDEGDHFVGGTPQSSCDGVNTPCTWSHVDCPTATTPTCPSDDVGEINGNLAGLLATEKGDTTPFSVHSDSAPTFYVNGNPAPGTQLARGLERDVGGLTATNPYTGATDTITRQLVDPVGMKLLHMVTGDPARTPTFVQFADPNYFLFAGAQNCTNPCAQVQHGFAWNHGDSSDDIANTWAGLVGPGVRSQGQTGSTWSDHTDVRPTILSLLGLRDDYSTDGRVLVDALDTSALPPGLRQHRDTVRDLGAIYKQINAPFGQFNADTLKVSTAALESSDESRYSDLEGKLKALGDRRDSLAASISAALNGATFDNRPLDESRAERMIHDARVLLAQADALAASA